MDGSGVGRERRMLWLVEDVRLHSNGVGKGAELSGLPYVAFMRVLGGHGDPMIDYPVDELERELGVLGVG